MPTELATQEQKDEFNPAALILLLPLATAAWSRYVPRRYAATPSQRWLNRVIAGLKGEAKAVTRKFIDGDVSRAEWELWMREYLSITYIIGTAAALKTFELSAADLQIASEQERSQLAYYSAFMGQLSSGEQKKNGSLLARVGLYIGAAWGLMWFINGVKARLGGYTEERRILGKADHCPDCLRYAGMGWQPIGTLPDPGVGSVCLSNCRCRKEYR